MIDVTAKQLNNHDNSRNVEKSDLYFCVFVFDSHVVFLLFSAALVSFLAVPTEVNAPITAASAANPAATAFQPCVRATFKRRLNL